jgi:hypothetical protein
VKEGDFVAQNAGHHIVLITSTCVRDVALFIATSAIGRPRVLKDDAPVAGNLFRIERIAYWSVLT